MYILRGNQLQKRYVEVSNKYNSTRKANPNYYLQVREKISKFTKFESKMLAFCGSTVHVTEILIFNLLGGDVEEQSWEELAI
jgi:hypothetical protein